MQTINVNPRQVQTIVRSLYRLFRVADVHALDNEAIGMTIQGTLSAFQTLENFSRDGVSFIAEEDTVIVNGQLLRAPPEIYQEALDFGKALRRLDANALTLAGNLNSGDLYALLTLYSRSLQGAVARPQDGQISTNIRIRRVPPELLLSLDDERLGGGERFFIAYAMAAMFYRSIERAAAESSFRGSSAFKRLARQLAITDFTEHPSIVELILRPHAQTESAQRAIHRAVVASLIVQQFTKDNDILMRVAMAALCLELERSGAERSPLDGAEAQIVSGSLRGDALERSIIISEARALLLRPSPAPRLLQGNPPALESRIVATSARIQATLQAEDPAPAGQRLEALRAHSTDALEVLVIELFIQAIGYVPRGTPVELESGYRGLVLQGGATLETFRTPVLLLLEDANGNPTQAFQADLSVAEARQALGGVSRILLVPSDTLQAARVQYTPDALALEERLRGAGADVLHWLEASHKDTLATGIPAGSLSGAFAPVGVTGSHAAIGASGAHPRITGMHSRVSGSHQALDSGAFAAIPDSDAPRDLPMAVLEFTARSRTPPHWTTTGDLSGSVPAV